MPRYFIDKVRDTHVAQDMYTPNWELVGQGLAAKEQEFNKVQENLDILENFNINIVPQDITWFSEEKSKISAEVEDINKKIIEEGGLTPSVKMKLRQAARNLQDNMTSGPLGKMSQSYQQRQAQVALADELYKQQVEKGKGGLTAEGKRQFLNNWGDFKNTRESGVYGFNAPAGYLDVNDTAKDLAEGTWNASGWNTSTIKFIPETGVYRNESSGDHITEYEVLSSITNGVLNDKAQMEYLNFEADMYFPENKEVEYNIISGSDKNGNTIYKTVKGTQKDAYIYEKALKAAQIQADRIGFSKTKNGQYDFKYEPGFAERKQKIQEQQDLINSTVESIARVDIQDAGYYKNLGAQYVDVSNKLEDARTVLNSMIKKGSTKDLLDAQRLVVRDLKQQKAEIYNELLEREVGRLNRLNSKYPETSLERRLSKVLKDRNPTDVMIKELSDILSGLISESTAAKDSNVSQDITSFKYRDKALRKLQSLGIIDEGEILKNPSLIRSQSLGIIPENADIETLSLIRKVSETVSAMKNLQKNADEFYKEYSENKAATKAGIVFKSLNHTTDKKGALTSQEAKIAYNGLTAAAAGNYKLYTPSDFKYGQAGNQPGLTLYTKDVKKPFDISSAIALFEEKNKDYSFDVRDAIKIIRYAPSGVKGGNPIKEVTFTQEFLDFVKETYGDLKTETSSNNKRKPSSVKPSERFWLEVEQTNEKSQAFEAARRGGYDDTPAYSEASNPKDTKIYTTIHNQGANSNKVFFGIDDKDNEVRFDAIFMGEGQGYKLYRTTTYDDENTGRQYDKKVEIRPTTKDDGIPYTPKTDDELTEAISYLTYKPS